MTLLSVPDMTCGHCKSSIEAALSALPGTGEITVDLPNHKVTVSGPAAPEALLSALNSIGYPAQVLPA